MSLIGSLEDLGLGDILQIISLSQKSGVLTIRGNEREGRIVLQEGLVRGASVKGGPTNLRDVLVDGRFLSAAEFDGAAEAARREGATVEEALSRHTSMTAERIDSLRRECVEAAVMDMFGWGTGEFSFDVNCTLDDEPALFLPTGINAQYLAMEGSRIEDETAHVQAEWRGQAEDPTGSASEEMSAHEMFGVEPSEEAADPLPAVEWKEPAEEALPIGGNEPLDLSEGLSEPASSAASAEEAEVELSLDEELEPDEIELAPVDIDVLTVTDPVEVMTTAVVENIDTVETAPAAPEEAPAVDPSSPLPSFDSPLVVIDSDPVALEWAKNLLKPSFVRVHAFQRWDLGLGPIRQYLARAIRPIVLIGSDVPGDPLSGIRSAADFVARLKQQAPRMHVMWLRGDGGPEIAAAAGADGVLTRPNADQLRGSRTAARVGELSVELCQRLADALSRGADREPGESRRRASESRSASGGSTTAEELRRLKEATASLSNASSRGEILPLVIRFAAETFDRVAMFMVRGDSVAGMAQQGLGRCGGPDDAALREVEMQRDACAWFRAVLEAAAPIRSAPSDGGDYKLAALLGSAAAAEAYLAPIESGGEIVALLYADNLPSGAPLGGTHTLEVVLHNAGLALERAMLERALAEAEEPT